MSNLNVQSVTSYFLLKYTFLCDKHIFWKSLLPWASFSLLSLRQCFLAHLMTLCHIFLILSYINIFLSESYLSLIPFSSHVSSITVSPAMPSTTPNISSQMPSVNGWYPNNPTKQYFPWSVNVSNLLSPCCPPAAPLLPATSLASRLLLATCHPTLVLAIAARHLVSHPALISAPPTFQTK